MRVITSALIAITTATSLASAQRTQHAPSPSPGAVARRVAAIAPAPTPPLVPVYPQRFYGHGGFRYYDLPIVLMADGRVFADFGRGFEQVVRSCGLPPAYSSPGVVSPSGLQQPVVVQPTVTQPAVPGVERLPYTPPVPAQQTPSQQIAAHGGRLPQESVASQSCWAVSPNGRILVAHP
jgi:hypothetical protein